MIGRGWTEGGSGRQGEISRGWTEEESGRQEITRRNIKRRWRCEEAFGWCREIEKLIFQRRK